MRFGTTGLFAWLVLAGCGRASAPPAADSTAMIKRVDDSVVALRVQQAPALADTARRALASLLKHPADATFDSVIVVLPPRENGVWPTSWVCGRMVGAPSRGGWSRSTRFIYRNAVTVFVLDDNNGAAFAALWARSCANPAALTLLK